MDEKQTSIARTEATQPVIKEQSEEWVQLVSFTLGKEEYALPILKVQEINRLLEVTNIPRSPDYLEGVVNLRGRVIPVISLQKRFGVGKEQTDQESRIVIVDVMGKTIGFTVDSVKEVIRISTAIIEPPPQFAGGVDRAYLSGVAKLEDRLVILLDLDQVLSSEELTEVQKAA